MTDNEYIMKIHDEILEIMDVIHTICIKHNLKYYLTGGSLLGAVRHKGFIPWDDDLDIAMPRNDYNRFLEICKDELPKGYITRNFLENFNYPYLFAKVCNQNTIFLDSLIKHENATIGIYVDIFPLDDSNGHIKTTFLKKEMIKKISYMIREQRNIGTLAGVKKVVAHMLPNTFLMKALKFLMCGSNNKGKLYYTNFASQYPVERKTQLKTVYGNGTPIQFEDRMYMAPDDYITDLLSNFGPKYMELPPVEKRRTHYPLKVVFSDGSVFEPTSIKDNKVSVEESINW